MKRYLFSIFKQIRRLFSGKRLGRFKPIRMIYQFLFSHLKPDFIIAKGHKIYLESTDTVGLSFREDFAPLKTRLFEKNIQQGDVILDVGAHIGYYTLIAAKLVGKNGRVFAFEPDPINFSLLKKNIEENGYKNVVLVNKAVSNKPGKIKLFLSKNNKADNRIYDSGDERESVDIEAIRLDDFFKNYTGKIDLIKIHVQGAEGWVFSGMLNLLNKNKNLKLITAFWPAAIEKSGFNPEEYLNKLIKYKFRLYYINQEGRKIEPVDIATIMKVGLKKDTVHLFCKH